MIKYYRKVINRLSNAASSFIEEIKVPLYKKSYSQYGEDMVLRAIFARFPRNYKGYYIDIGAHHPRRFSNTKCFYDQGWSGCCVDPLPACEKLFKTERPRDTVINAGISDTSQTLEYYMHKDPAFNTFSKPKDKQKVITAKTIEVITLKQLFENNDRTQVDFLSIDAEGFDEKILTSYDWANVRPTVILYEETGIRHLNEVAESACSIYLRSKNYIPLIRTPSALFYFDISSPRFDGSCYLNYK